MEKKHLAELGEWLTDMKGLPADFAEDICIKVEKLQKKAKAEEAKELLKDYFSL